jgi:hypothetical protein
MLVPLPPGKSYDFVMHVSELSDVTRPGQYSIQIQRRDSNEPASSMVKSNIITITVLPESQDVEPK